MIDTPVQQPSGFVAFIEKHPFLVIGGIVIGGVLLGSALKRKDASTATTAAPLNSGINPMTGQPFTNANSNVYGSNVGALFNGGSAASSYNNGINPYTGQPYVNNSGLTYGSTGQPIAFVPTTTSFQTNNVGAQFTGQTGQVNVQATNSITPTAGNTAIPRIVRRNNIITTSPASTVAPAQPIATNPIPTPSTPTVVANPQPVSQPPVTAPKQKSMMWSGSYTVAGGDTLSSIAQKATMNLRSQGAPATTLVTYQQIYNNNQGIIDSTASAHGNPIPGGPWNNIFPGETIRIPVWV